MANRIVVITGATSGIGLAVATLLLEQGFDVFGVGSSARVVLVEAELKNKFPNRLIRFFQTDMSMMANVRELGKAIVATMSDVGETSLYALINNAGGVVSSYQLTKENIEYQFALNHLSTLVLTRELLEPLQGGMVLFTGSNSHHHAKIHWRNLYYKRFYWIFGPYRQSKLANLLTAKKLNEILRPQRIQAYVVDPGLVKTAIGTRSMKGLGRLAWLFVSRKGITPEVAALTYSHIIRNRPLEGLYFLNSQPSKYHPVADNLLVVDRLFQLSCDLANIRFPSSDK
jgi:retinol dehydrogenase 14